MSDWRYVAPTIAAAFLLATSLATYIRFLRGNGDFE
jgi:hypothetical protein